MLVKLFSKFFCHELLLLDAGLLTGEVAEVEDACPADFTDLIELDAVDSRRLIREDSFDTHATGNFADGEGPGESILSADLDDDASEFLQTLFVAFLDLVGHGDGITGLELRIFGNFPVLERLLN